MKKTITLITLFCFTAGTIPSFMSGQKQFKTSAHNLSGKPQVLYDSIYYWTLDTTAKTWDFSSREIDIVYNAGNKITSDLIQNWNGTAWVNFTKDTYLYNANNFDTSDVELSWTGSAWENEYHYTYTYDASDSETSETEQIWTGSAWRNYMKYVYTYDAHNNKTSQEGEQWNGSAWTYGWLYSFTFNANNLKTEEIDSSNVSSERFIYNYNAHNLLISDTSQYWGNNAWDEDFNYGYAYNANNLDTSEVMQQLNGNVWENYERYAYDYDAHNNNTGQLFQNWSANAWVRFQQFAYIYNASNIMQSEEERQYFNGGNEVLLGDSTYWYFHISTKGVQQLSVVSSQWSVYPNPSKGTFTIEIKNEELIMKNAIEIYNVLGEKVYQSQNSGLSSAVSISIDVPNGVYFIRIQNEQGFINGKIIIQK